MKKLCEFLNKLLHNLFSESNKCNVTTREQTYLILTTIMIIIIEYMFCVPVAL